MRLIRPILAAAFLAHLAGAASALGSSGAYLAARHASYLNDFSQAAEYYTRALALDPSNPALMEAVITSDVNMGSLDRAVPVADHMADLGMNSQVAFMVQMADRAATGNYDAILTALDTSESVGALVDGLAKAWAYLGAGKVTEALAAFDAVASEEGLQSFALYQKAIALASVGDFEGADDILSGRAKGPLQATRRSVMAHAEVLSQLERPDAALALISDTMGSNPPPTFAAMVERLKAGETLQFDVVDGAAGGIGEVFHGVASALAGEAAPGYALLYARIAAYLNPDNIDAQLLCASLLEDMAQYDLAISAYDVVPRENPEFVSAELGRADALKEAGKTDAAVEALTQLAKTYPDLQIVQRQLGDTLRGLERYSEATGPYDRAIALVGTEQPADWTLYFSRGVTYERTDQWEKAEADFRHALRLSPAQPQVLNYLGYSMVERHEDLDEALDMIRRAVAAQPDDGYITDSLGWVYYRLGRYDKAVGQMERAAELMPTDPIINDHLGDVYWAVGRRMEAQFQWHRALSFGPEPDEADRIRRKLEVGLDKVLEQEGAKPLAVAKDG
ncbi:MAG: tetratricopeptide repeat protein [Rhodobacteraceae bacterium]|nr:tetratricopeptide repeat protein [Paracoccaceae bacterium]MCB1344460.1 tetratricopeptide repeat protein [Paracoccaceae bacterium]